MINRTGKTQICNQFLGRSFDRRWNTTFGENFVNSIDIDDKCVYLDVWDTAGHPKWNKMSVSIYDSIDIGIIVFDLNNPKSFKDIAKWMQTIIKHGNISNKEWFPFIFVGNKCDLHKKVSSVEKKMKNWINRQKLKRACYIEASALNNYNIESLFAKATRLRFEYDGVYELLVNGYLREMDDILHIPQHLGKLFQLFYCGKVFKNGRKRHNLFK